MFNILDADSRFVSNGFTQARALVKSDSNQPSRGGGSGGRFQHQGSWIPLLHHLRKSSQLPVVVFSFSKKRCEAAALSLLSQDLTTGQEKAEIHRLCQAALSRLPEVDRSLPQIRRIREMLGRGIGVHHSGLLPVVKELVEMAFGKGVVKILFATETFAMGVNMPTKTVVFNGLRKHDGTDFRDILPGEYTQMAGRAGRRGLDSFGNVVISCSDGKIPDESTVRNLILGKATKLESKFRLTYSMILNLLRVEDMRVEDMIKRSFCEFEMQQYDGKHKEMIQEGENTLAEMDAVDCIYGNPQFIEQYFDLHDARRRLERSSIHWIISSRSCEKYLASGRVIIVTKFNLVNIPGIILRATTTLVTALLVCPVKWRPSKKLQQAVDRFDGSVQFGQTDHSVPYLICNITSDHIVRLCNESIKTDANEILIEERKSAIYSSVNQIQNLSPEQLNNSLDPIRDMKIKDVDFVSNYSQLTRLEPLSSIKCHECPKLEEHFTLQSGSHRVNSRLAQLRHLISDGNIELIADMNLRINVLNELHYVDPDRALEVKGRVACEVNSCDCLIVTELIFENVLCDIEPAEVAALLSVLIFQGKSDNEPKLIDSLVQLRDKLFVIATSLGNLQLKGGVDCTPESYIKENCNAALMEVVYEWAKGTSFAAICEMTDVEEGSIVRCIVRLAEACRDVRNAARVIGDSKLYVLMEAAANAIKRDIVFAASLYVT